MMVSHRRRLGATTAVMAAVLAAAVPAQAHAADFETAVPAGLACDFELGIAGTGGSMIDREFTDADGNLVRTLTAGTGQALTFTNLGTDESLSFPSNGAVTRTTYHPDGSTTVQLTGHNVLILFPSDVPAGPSTTLYVGRVTYTVDTSEVFTLQTTSGQSIDICAELE